MYIIELVFRLKEKYQNGGIKGLFRRESTAFSKENSSFVQEQDLEAEYESCEHIFRPIDSTNTVLACVKCGYLIHCSEDEFKKKNIFEDNLPE